jgi:hypothetical protein
MFNKQTPLSVALAILCVPFVFGCGDRPTLPQTYPVHGKVVHKGGGPVAGGGLRLLDRGADLTMVTSGAIAADGTFTVNTFKVGVRSVGAPPGTYRVLIVPASDEGHGRGGGPTTLPEPCVIKPGDNELTFVVP